MKKRIKKLIIIIIALFVIFALYKIIDGNIKTVSARLSLSSSWDNPPKYAAHRGLSKLYPENTVKAFNGAGENGFYAFEFDIHTTSDGEWIVIHDDTVDKMTAFSGEVSSFTLDEIRNMPLDNGANIKDYPDTVIPTLNEALGVCDEYDIVPVIEIKSCDKNLLPEFYNILKEHSLTDKAVIISFDLEYLKIIRSLDSNICIMLLTHKVTDENVDTCIENNFGLDFNYKKLLQSLKALKKAKANNIMLGAWTVDNTIAADILAGYGIELITTNRIVQK